MESLEQVGATGREEILSRLAQVNAAVVVEQQLDEKAKQVYVEEQIIAQGRNEYGMVEMLVRKRNGVLVMLQELPLQVVNTPRGPKNVKPKRPAVLPLVRVIRQSEAQRMLSLSLYQRPSSALLTFQGEHGPVSRELFLTGD